MGCGGLSLAQFGPEISEPGSVVGFSLAAAHAPNDKFVKIIISFKRLLDSYVFCLSILSTPNIAPFLSKYMARPETYPGMSPVQPETHQRLQFKTDTVVARGWPSAGGILVKGVDAIELAFLGLDRFHEVDPSPDQAEEDAFCDRL
ncbi:hypothetical protein GTA08_BOTSDO08739 [Botryosphaeria dothidea]|uniref:Uncharacterized protein n=1 Tax=Botryosphaeria dothidea TaxID=55169 RepID=A0A8H4N520_9PEZI|nr:hypothetical protein GTA08_BOTSDO08739 [Botryosphaeria dothidea]